MALVIARVLHPFGLTIKAGPTVLRAVSTILTWIILVTAGIALIYGHLSSN